MTIPPVPAARSISSLARVAALRGLGRVVTTEPAGNRSSSSANAAGTLSRRSRLPNRSLEPTITVTTSRSRTPISSSAGSWPPSSG